MKSLIVELIYLPVTAVMAVAEALGRIAQRSSNAGSGADS